MFSEKDLAQIAAKGIEIEKINTQIDNFKKGFPPTELTGAAVTDNGLISFSEDEVKTLVEEYENLVGEKSVLKFVPASGAASRMFKHLFEFKDNYKADKEEEFFQDKGFNSVFTFFNRLKDFAFYNDLEEIFKSNNKDLTQLIEQKAYVEIISSLLDDSGLDYAQLPKGLLKFHNYEDGSRMSIEEHLVEGAVYGKDNAGNVNIHFTVSPEHMEKFKTAISKVSTKYEKAYNVKLNVAYSIQKPSTDILAVNLKNEPFRDETGNLVFRPGGHGALIENLNELDQDIIFVKNIDNIVPDRLRDTTYTYKKVLASYLIQLQSKTFEYLRVLEADDLSKLEEITTFAKEKLMIHLPDSFENDQAQKNILFTKLNRPMRTCGMVKNEGEPGGGPFWTKNLKGDISLQIVEGSQMDLSIGGQKEIVQQATHFNPVDLVCGVKGYKGRKFDLTQFVDKNTGFISEKSQNGKSLKAQELPGLWNGAMADWITVFVECPIITFNPVKIVNDLLRDQHQ